MPDEVPGLACRLAADGAVARDAMEWLLLEGRCGPFLRLEIAVEPEADVMWLRVGGGPGR